MHETDGQPVLARQIARVRVDDETVTLVLWKVRRNGIESKDPTKGGLMSHPAEELLCTGHLMYS